MNYIHDLDELKNLVEESEENIIYPMREEGIIFLDYFRYTNETYRYNFKESKFCCIAKDELHINLIQRTIQNLPVIPLKNLVHFKETANFFVAVPDDKINYVANLLNNFGCKNIFIVTGKVLAQMKVEIEEFRKSGLILDWYMNSFTKEIENIKSLVELQNEITCVNTKAFSEYRNAFRDKKIVIVAGGPTTQYYKQMPDAIHIGINLAWLREDISFDYLFTHDVTGKLNIEQGFDKIKEKVFINKRLVTGWEGLVYPEEISINHKNVVRFYSNDDYADQHLYQDICCHPLMDFCSTVFTALHFSLFTYPKEIYLVGCDVSSVGHFYDTKTASGVFVTKLKVGYARAKMFANHFYPDTKIISINPVGLKNLFEDIYTDDYKKILED